MSDGVVDLPVGRRSTSAAPAQKSAKATRRREELIATAYEVFVDKGYFAAGVADIADRLSIGHGTFYRYFESKRDILDYVIDFGFERLSDDILGQVWEKEPQDADQYFDMWRDVLERVFAKVTQEPRLIKLLLFESTSIDEELTERFFGLNDIATSATAGHLEEGVARGFIRPDIDIDIVAEATNAALAPGLVSIMRDDSNPDAQRKYIDSVLSLIRYGLDAKPAQGK